MECITVHYGQSCGRPRVYKDRDLRYLPTIVYGIRFTFSRSDTRFICNSSVQWPFNSYGKSFKLYETMCSYVLREIYRGPGYCQWEGHQLQARALSEARFYILKLVYIVSQWGMDSG